LTRSVAGSEPPLTGRVAGTDRSAWLSAASESARECESDDTPSSKFEIVGGLSPLARIAGFEESREQLDDRNAKAIVAMKHGAWIDCIVIPRMCSTHCRPPPVGLPA
jgi:hypothetical protein